MKTRRDALLTLLAAGALAACGSMPASAPPPYVLVHGAFQDGRAWANVTPLLRSKGAKVAAIDLPGRANDGTAPEAATLDGYRDHVAQIVAAQNGPVVLVGMVSVASGKAVAYVQVPEEAA